MGDRANVRIQDGDDSVYFYTHWSGTELPVTVANALDRGRDRWDDPPYLSRIIFCQMVKGQENSNLGFGISPTCGDGDDRIIAIDCGSQEVIFRDLRYSFEDYVLGVQSGTIDTRW